MTPLSTKSPKIPKGGLGYNQLQILQLLEDLSVGKRKQDIHYHGGGITTGQRYVAMGRSSELFYNLPHSIIDLRHASRLFNISESQRLGENTTKTFNRAIHGLLRRGFLLPVSHETIRQGSYDDGKQHRITGRLRFVRLNAHYA